ncbi:MAG: hypothetical protein V7765_21350 [Oleispira sp.]
MGAPWTGKMQNECARLYSMEGSSAAVAYTGKTLKAVRGMMDKMGVKCAHTKPRVNLNLNPRKWWAEDVAELFCMVSDGVTYSICSEYFNTTKKAIESVMHNARTNGFAAYPMRGEQ